MDAERKAIAEIKLDGDQPGHVTAVFATLNTIDRDGDVVLPGAFTNGQRVKMMWAHDWTKWIGDGQIHVKGKEAIFEGDFWTETIDGAEAYKKVKRAGDLAEWSWGFFVPPDASHAGEFQGQQVRFLGDKPLEIPEVSPVAVGAGIRTRTIAVKSNMQPVPGGEAAAALLQSPSEETIEPSDLPFTEHLEAVLTEVAGLAARTQERAAFRAKEGRRLSAATRRHLAQLREEMNRIQGDIDGLLAEESAPKDGLDPIDLKLWFDQFEERYRASLVPL